MADIFHLLLESQWRAAAGAEHYVPARFAQDGFVHCAGEPETALRLYLFGTQDTGDAVNILDWQPHEDEPECAPDCDERADCDHVGQPGHTMCGRNADGTPRHHGPTPRWTGEARP